MRDANLNDGDLLIIDRAETPRHKSIVVAVLNGEFVVKRLHKRNGEVKLLSENKAYPAIEDHRGHGLRNLGRRQPHHPQGALSVRAGGLQ